MLKTTQAGRKEMQMKRVLARLIQWLRGRGMAEADIMNCIEYILK